MKVCADQEKHGERQDVVSSLGGVEIRWQLRSRRKLVGKGRERGDDGIHEKLAIKVIRHVVHH